MLCSRPRELLPSLRYGWCVTDSLHGVGNQKETKFAVENSLLEGTAPEIRKQFNASDLKAFLVKLNVSQFERSYDSCNMYHTALLALLFLISIHRKRVQLTFGNHNMGDWKNAPTSSNLTAVAALWIIFIDGVKCIEYWVSSCSNIFRISLLHSRGSLRICLIPRCDRETDCQNRPHSGRPNYTRNASRTTKKLAVRIQYLLIRSAGSSHIENAWSERTESETSYWKK